MWDAVFILITLLIMVLPMIPGMVELALATDTQPLRVIQEYDSDVAHFANGFRSYLQKSFPNFFAQLEQGTVKFQDGSLDGRTRYQIIGPGSVPFFDQKEVSVASTRKLIVSAEALQLPRDMFFESEVYSTTSITAGRDSQFRALLAEESITLGEGCATMRWVHCTGTLNVAQGCQLMGRASAGQEIFISEHVKFERLNAPRIVFGQHGLATMPDVSRAQAVKLEDIVRIKDRFERRWLVEGTLELPENSYFDGDIVAGKDIIIGAGSHIKGSIKSNGDLIVGPSVLVQGSAFSAGDLTLSSGSFVGGPVVAEKALLLQSGVTIGTLEAPTTVTADIITVASGVEVHGTLWANEPGSVGSQAGLAT